MPAYKGRGKCCIFNKTNFAIFISLTLLPKNPRVAVVEWLEQLGYGAESRRIA